MLTMFSSLPPSLLLLLLLSSWSPFPLILLLNVSFPLCVHELWVEVACRTWSRHSLPSYPHLMTVSRIFKVDPRSVSRGHFTPASKRPFLSSFAFLPLFLSSPSQFFIYSPPPSLIGRARCCLGCWAGSGAGRILWSEHMPPPSSFLVPWPQCGSR